MSIRDDAICTPDDVKQYYLMMDQGEIPSIAGIDDLIEDLINQYTVMFNSICNRSSFKATDYTERYNGLGQIQLYVKNSPINSITSLYDDTSYDFTSDSLISSDDYEIINLKYILLKDSVFSTGVANIKVTYNGGYSTIPLDLKNVCVKEVSRSLKHRQEIDVVSKAFRDGNVNYQTDGLLKSTLMVINKYKVNWIV